MVCQVLETQMYPLYYKAVLNKKANVLRAQQYVHMY